MADIVRRGGNDAVTINVRVQPGARRTGVVGRHGDALKIRVTAAPHRGRANAMVERLVAEVFGVPVADVVVTRGATSRTKQVRVAGLRVGPATECLRGLLDEADDGLV